MKLYCLLTRRSILHGTPNKTKATYFRGLICQGTFSDLILNPFGEVFESTSVAPKTQAVFKGALWAMTDAKTEKWFEFSCKMFWIKSYLSYLMIESDWWLKQN